MALIIISPRVGLKNIKTMNDETLLFVERGDGVFQTDRSRVADTAESSLIVELMDTWWLPGGSRNRAWLSQ